MTSDQLREWQGKWGDEYTERNSVGDLEARQIMWEKGLGDASIPCSVLEVGANTGLNLEALNDMFYPPKLSYLSWPRTRVAGPKLYGLEPNRVAREEMAEKPYITALNGNAQAIPMGDSSIDLVLTCGLLIHIEPRYSLLPACSEIHRVAKRYILCVEYFNDVPQEVLYRDKEGMMWRRDWGRYWLSNFPKLRCVDNGFFWKETTGLDNLHWWLMEKGEIDAPS